MSNYLTLTVHHGNEKRMCMYVRECVCACVCVCVYVCESVTVRSFISRTMIPQIVTCLAILVLSRLLWRSGGCTQAYKGLGKDLEYVCVHAHMHVRICVCSWLVSFVQKHFEPQHSKTCVSFLKKKRKSLFRLKHTVAYEWVYWQFWAFHLEIQFQRRESFVWSHAKQHTAAFVSFP